MPLTERERDDPRRAGRGGAAPGSTPTRRTGAGSPSGATALPRGRRALDADQRRVPRRSSRTPPGDEPPDGGDAWQAAIFDRRQAATTCHRGRAFAAIYLAFLGRPNGPRAGWLLASLDRDFVVPSGLRQRPAGPSQAAAIERRPVQ